MSYQEKILEKVMTSSTTNEVGFHKEFNAVEAIKDCFTLLRLEKEIEDIKRKMLESAWVHDWSSQESEIQKILNKYNL